MRPARWGVPAAFDPYGRTLAIMNESSAEQRVITAQVPVSGLTFQSGLAQSPTANINREEISRENGSSRWITRK
jgi:hypothetical protein